MYLFDPEGYDKYDIGWGARLFGIVIVCIGIILMIVAIVLGLK